MKFFAEVAKLVLAWLILDLLVQVLKLIWKAIRKSTRRVKMNLRNRKLKNTEFSVVA